MGQFLSRKEQKARKTRCCDTCHSEIMPGESYVRIAFTDDGKVRDYSQHIHCDALAERYCMAMGTDEFDGDDVCWWAQEEVCAECDKWADACEHTALTCPLVLKALLPPTLLTHEDVRKHIEITIPDTKEKQDG